MSAVQLNSNGWDDSSSGRVSRNALGAGAASSRPTLRNLRLWRAGVVMSAIMFFLLVLALPVFALVPAQQRHTPQVSVFDQAQILQPEAMKNSLEQVKFTQDIHLVVITFASLDGLDLNTATLKFAREHDVYPPLIHPTNPQFWNDSTLILSLAPNERLVGTYFGEDVKVDLGTQADIQESMKEELRTQQWASAFVTGAQTSAYELSTDAKDSLVTWIAAGGVSVAGILGFARLIERRMSVRGDWRQARAHYANVNADFDTVALEAGILDHSDRHGAAIVERYAEYVQRYHSLTLDFQDFGTPRGLDLYVPSVRKEAQRLRAEAAALDDLDDAISNTAALLTMSSRWEQVWMNETGPVHEDIESLRELIQRVSQHLSSSRVGTLTEKCAAIEHEVAEILPALQRRTLTPTQALDKLDALHQKVFNLSQTVLYDIAAVTRAKGAHVSDSDFSSINEWNTTGYSGRWGSQRYNPHSTIRGNTASSSGSSTGFLSGTTGSIAGLVIGYQTSAINPAVYEASQSSSSSSYSSGGYSGGGFSGAGSSSSF